MEAEVDRAMISRLSELQKRLLRGEHPSPETLEHALMNVQLGLDEEQHDATGNRVVWGPCDGNSLGVNPASASVQEPQEPVKRPVSCDVKQGRLPNRKGKPRKLFLSHRTAAPDFECLANVCLQAAVVVVCLAARSAQQRAQSSANPVPPSLPVSSEAEDVPAREPTEEAGPQASEPNHPRPVVPVLDTSSALLGGTGASTESTSPTTPALRTRHCGAAVSGRVDPSPSSPPLSARVPTTSPRRLSYKASDSQLSLLHPNATPGKSDTTWTQHSANREEGRTRKVTAATVEVRRYQAIVAKLEADAEKRKAKEAKEVSRALERAATLQDTVNELRAEIAKLRSNKEEELRGVKEEFSRDLERVQCIYQEDLEATQAECYRQADVASHLKVRSREELVEGGKEIERARHAKLVDEMCRRHRAATTLLSQAHEEQTAKLRREHETTQRTLASLRSAASAEVLSLRKQVEYLFEYCRNLAKILLHSKVSESAASLSSAAGRALQGTAQACHYPPGVSVLSRKRLKKPSNSPIGLDAVDLNLLPHVQSLWRKTQEHIARETGHPVQDNRSATHHHPQQQQRDCCCFSWVSYPPVCFAVGGDEIRMQSTTASTAELPGAKDDTLSVVSSMAAHEAQRRTPCFFAREKSASSSRAKAASSNSNGRTPDVDCNDCTALRETASSVAKERDFYREQLKEAMSKAKDTRLALDSKNRVIQKLQKQGREREPSATKTRHQQGLTPSQPHGGGHPHTNAMSFVPADRIPLNRPSSARLYRTYDPP
ncbi:hypothetical protein DIPPA_34934 [Diplonema papillatum]|nr:hypothetical protein DIPPA_34934 [Diplonema papillatum]